MFTYTKDRTDKGSETVEWMFCPFARNFPVTDEHYAETPSTPDYRQECKGQFCMAWRWYDKDECLGYCGLVPQND